MHVLVVDDVTVAREVLRAVACSAIDEAVVCTASSLEEALMVARGMAGLETVLLDLGLPGCEGVDALLRFKAAFPAARIIVVSADDSPGMIADAMRAGASGFVSKRGIPADMFEAIRVVADGGRYAPSAVRS